MFAECWCWCWPLPFPNFSHFYTISLPENIREEREEKTNLHCNLQFVRSIFCWWANKLLDLVFVVIIHKFSHSHSVEKAETKNVMSSVYSFSRVFRSCDIASCMDLKFKEIQLNTINVLWRLTIHWDPLSCMYAFMLTYTSVFLVTS